jgi:hypothetical protein
MKLIPVFAPSVLLLAVFVPRGAGAPPTPGPPKKGA